MKNQYIGNIQANVITSRLSNFLFYFSTLKLKLADSINQKSKFNN